MNWDISNGLLTEKERDMISVALELMSNDSNILLSGSLMLAVAGVVKRREAHDIDFVVADFAGNHKLPKGATEGNGSSDGTCLSYVYKGYKVDILSSNETPTEIGGIRCASYTNLLKSKYGFSTQDNPAAEKHRLDLLHLGVYSDYKKWHSQSAILTTH